MSKGYSEFFDEINKKILEVSASEEIGEKERREIIKCLSDLLMINIHQSQIDINVDYLSDSISLRCVDAQLHDIYISTEAGSEEYQNALKLCDRQRKLLEKFHSGGWEVPDINYLDIVSCKDYFEKKQESSFLNEKIDTLYLEINSLANKAVTTFDLTTCENVLLMLDRLEQYIEEGRQKNIVIHNVSQHDTEEKRQIVLKAKKIGQEREEALNEIEKLEREIVNLDSRFEADPEKWREIISLCNKLDKLSADCVRREWSDISSNVDTYGICAKYEYYLEADSLDRWISDHRNNLEKEEDYIEFIDKCSKQADHLKIFKNSGWKEPLLINPDPNLLKQNVRQELYDIKNRTAIKKMFVKVGIGVCCFLCICVVGLLLFLKDRRPFPYDNESIVGISYQEVVQKLTDIGFTNIKSVESSEGWLSDNSVLSFTVDGNESIKEGSRQKKDAEITIEFSSDGRVNLTDVLKDWHKKSYLEIQEEMKQDGILIIKTEPEDTYEQNEDGHALKISFDNQEFTEGECFIPKEMPVEIVYGIYKIPIGYSNSEILGKDYREIVEDLNNKGFTNIETKETKEGWAPGNSIVKFEIDGNSSFEAKTGFVPDSKIGITYSSENRVDITDSLNKTQGKTCTELRDLLRKKGLGNVILQRTDTFDIDKNQLVSKVYIGNKEYTGGECFVRASETVRIEYNYLKIKADDGFEFEEKNYHDYADFLKEQGFSDITLKRSDNLVNGWLNKEGTVRKVLADGEEFHTGEVYNYDSKIEIIVNTFKKKGYEDITEIAE